jgi:molybdenum cofactor biosynthesis enzyme MoaA
LGKLLTIETGFTCNSRCHYCTQLDYRVIPQADRLDLSTEQIRQRILWASQNGYDQIGFSGGEPTIRPDFLELIALAKSHDFERIGVTTNGRMFAYRDFTEKAMLAGLDGFTFSIHGPTPDVHDAITHAKGSLDQALAGLRNVAWVEKKHGLRAHLMNNQILLAENTRYLKDVVALLGPLGIKLFMIQPFIAQRSNVDDLGRFFIPYEEIEAAVAAAVPELAKWNARVKPYNVPNCLLWKFGQERVEPQFYGIQVFREFEEETAGEFKAFKAKQWYRVPQCKGCTEACPGFRIEQYPQAKMRTELLESAGRFHEGSPRLTGEGPLTFAGTELFDATTLREAIAEMAQAHGAIAWMTAACEKVPRAELAALACDLYEAGQLADLVLITQPLDQRFLAQRVLEKGNLEEMRQFLFHLGELRDAGRKIPRLRVLLNIGDLVRLLDDAVVQAQWPLLQKALGRAAGDTQVDAIVAVSNFPRGETPPDMERQADQNLALATRLRDALLAAGLRPLSLTLEDKRGLDPDRARQMATVEAQLATVLPQESWARTLFRHALAMPELDFVSWAPPWLFERWDLTTRALPEGSTPRRQPGTRTGLRQLSVAKVSTRVRP